MIWNYSELGARLEKQLKELSDSGLVEGKIWRAACTAEDQAAKKLLTGWMEAAALIEEEGSRFASGYLGSRAVNGLLDIEALRETDGEGITVAEALAQTGGSPDRINTACRENLESFLELHVEQGPILHEMGIEIGIVENIVGLYVYEIEIPGQQNHAGTTPMRMRLDPMAEAASVISLLSEIPASVSESACCFGP